MTNASGRPAPRVPHMGWFFTAAEMPRDSYLTMVRSHPGGDTKFRIDAETSGEAGLISSTNLNLSDTGSCAVFGKTN